MSARLIKVSDTVPTGPVSVPRSHLKNNSPAPRRTHNGTHGRLRCASKARLNYKNPRHKTAFALITASEQAGVRLERRRADRSALIAFQLVMGSHVVGRETPAAENISSAPPSSTLRDTHSTVDHRRSNSLASQCRTIGMEMEGYE